MISNKEILLEKKLYEDLKKQYRKRSKRHPEGEISFKFQHGKHRPYINKNGEKKHLGMRDPLLVSMLLEKKPDNMMLKCIEETIQLLDRLQYEYRGVDLWGQDIARAGNKHRQRLQAMRFYAKTRQSRGCDRERRLSQQ